jgi:hypothetical protein
MINTNKIFIFLIIIILLSACANEFLGSKKISYVRGFYVERWFLNPEYNKSEIPSGTEFYGAAADRIKHKFIIKYYIRDDSNSEKEIPSNNMWELNHNGKRANYQDDNDLMFYSKISENNYEKFKRKYKGKEYDLVIPKDILLPIKECDSTEWCLLYPTIFSKELYIKLSILKSIVGSYLER